MIRMILAIRKLRRELAVALAEQGTERGPDGLHRPVSAPFRPEMWRQS